jgi:mitogen-activated protein kinase organizer 1
VSLSQDQNCLLLSGVDNTVKLFDRSNGELLNEYAGLKCREFPIQSCLTNDDAFVLSGSEDGSIHFWSLVEAKLVHSLKGHQGPVNCVAYHPSQAMLVSGSLDGTIKAWTK